MGAHLYHIMIWLSRMSTIQGHDQLRIKFFLSHRSPFFRLSGPSFEAIVLVSIQQRRKSNNTDVSYKYICSVKKEEY